MESKVLARALDADEGAEPGREERPSEPSRLSRDELRGLEEPGDGGEGEGEGPACDSGLALSRSPASPGSAGRGAVSALLPFTPRELLACDGNVPEASVSAFRSSLTTLSEYAALDDDVNERAGCVRAQRHARKGD